MEKLMHYLKTAKVNYLAARQAGKELEEAGFIRLNLQDVWTLQPGGRYFVMPTDTSVTAFGIPEKRADDRPFFRMLAAHTDQPGLRIKPGAPIGSNGSQRLNAEIYGGPIYSTWMDRPLSLAGQVTLDSGDPFRPEKRLVDLEKPVLQIPNLAIHMNREVNSGTALNPQTDLLPLAAVGLTEEEEPGQLLPEALASALGVEASAILDYDLFAYPMEEPCRVGFHEEFLSSPRLDDLVMVYAGLEALVEAPLSGSVNLLALFDNEEVGSSTIGGANSAMLPLVLEKISLAMGRSREEFLQDVAGSFLISADVAHAMHPAHPEKHDPVLKTRLGGGPVIKISASQSYVTRSEDYCVYERLCRQAGIPVQKFVNRSDSRGGSTIGPALARWVPCRSMDMGIALLAMHSARELMAAADYDFTKRSFIQYYEM